MKEHPILFSADMVRAILGGRKTMTRRVNGLDAYNKEPDKWKIGAVYANDEVIFWSAWCDWSYSHKLKCPYGQVGDRLWVRETICQSCYKEDGYEDVCYKEDLLNSKTSDCELLTRKWTPSIFMPRWASRINLEITGVRVERLTDISEEDAIKEGVEYHTLNAYSQFRLLSHSVANKDNWPTPQEAFSKLWDSINTKRGYGWSVNPWVWVIEFKRN